jgi:succinate dehydrogenase / fumarate reductase membrane anchor subunit
MANYQTPMRRARGLGSAKHGVGHWISERVTAVVLVPLVLWAVWGALTIARGGYAGATAWLASPLNAVLTALLLAVGFLHMHAGMRVVVEDYIEKPGTKAALLILNLFVCGLGGALAVFCVIKVALTGGAF